MKRSLRAWLALAPRERRSLALLLVGLPLVAGLLRWRGLAGTQRWLEGFAGKALSRSACTDELHAARRLAELAAIAGRRGAVPATCLPQSLLVHALLRRRGLAPELKLGVRQGGMGLQAHAWVELDGIALGPGEADFTPLVTGARLAAS